MRGYRCFVLGWLCVVALVVFLCSMPGCGSHSPAPVIGEPVTVIHSKNFAWGEDPNCPEGTHPVWSTDEEGHHVFSCVPNP